METETPRGLGERALGISVAERAVARDIAAKALVQRGSFGSSAASGSTIAGSGA